MISQLLTLVLTSLVISASTFGGGSQALFYGYAVDRYHWLSKTDLSAILSFGYATPGPAVFGTAPFIGYRLAGLPGAVIGAAAIFAIPFTLSLLAAKYFSHLYHYPPVTAVIGGVGLCVSGLIIAASINLLQPLHVPPWESVLAISTLIISLRWKVNPLALLVVATGIGLVARSL